MKFSLLTPINLWNPDRVEQFLRCIKSVEAQTFRDFEWVIVDDGSTQDFLWDSVLLNKNIPQVELIHKEAMERVSAYNDAFKTAKGDWFVFLDSDDELPPDALEIWNRYIEKSKRKLKHTEYPTKIFNCGAIYHYVDGTSSKRDPFKPIWLGAKHGHEIFGGGNIVNGTFIFHRSVYEKLGGFMPDTVKDINTTEINYPPYPGALKPYIRDLHNNTPYDFAGYYQLEFPELRQYFMVDHEAEPDGKIIKELGNPWGQDFLLFYKYTRKYHSRPIKEYLYIVNPRP